MRLIAKNIEQASELLAAEFTRLKEISDMEDAGELHGASGLNEDEAKAFIALEEIIKDLKQVTDLL